MQFATFTNQLVRVTDTEGNTFTGFAEAFSAEYALHEYGREEAGLEIGNDLFFESDIRSIERVPSFEEAAAAIPPGVYRHFKGNRYQVLCLARHSETTEPMVVYRALYGEYGVWVRPAIMWNETVERDGKRFRRFERVQTEESERSEQITRIERYETMLNRATELLHTDDPALPKLIAELEAYYTSALWKQDFADDEAGLLPASLRRGVLSEDGIDALLEAYAGELS